MLKKIFLEILFFYFLAIFQMSFLAHFNFLEGRWGFLEGWWEGCSLILISVVLINFLNPQETVPDQGLSPRGFEAAFIGGFFLDIFSKSPLPLSILIFLVLALLIKKILRTFKITTKKFLIFSFFCILLFSLIFYDFILNFVLKYDLFF